MLKFSVNNQVITRENDFRVVADSQNYLMAEFTFSDEWKDDIIAIFGNSCGEFYNVIIDEGKCAVPWEVIKTPFFTVSVFCGDRITANIVTVDVEKSGFDQGETSKPPTPDAYMQILNSAKTPYIGENGNWYEWDRETKTYIDSKVAAKGYIPIRGTDYWTDEDKAEIKEYVDETILGGAW
ncbi:MAG: hypothetical protein IKW62_04435 [Clostridia bacterium]|nr:hypothetical protein [Clostridia bacterium]